MCPCTASCGSQTSRIFAGRTIAVDRDSDAIGSCSTAAPALEPDPQALAYVLYTSGLGTLGLATCMLIIDVWGYKKWTFLGRVYGANAITTYVLAGVLTLVFYKLKIGGASLSASFMNGLSQIGFDPKFASMLYAVIYMLIIFIPALILYRKKIFIKI